MVIQIGTIKALSLGRKEEGSIGFMTKEEDGKWYNISAGPKELDSLLETVLAKGNKIEFNVEMGIPSNLVLKEKAPEESGDWTNEMTNFEDLLNAAHEKFKDKLEISSEPLEDGDGNPMIDFEKKTAVFKATVRIAVGEDNRIFEAHGDATMGNISGMIAPHFIRMAETRAIARALRWATNNAKCAEEETEKGKLPEEKKK